MKGIQDQLNNIYSEEATEQDFMDMMEYIGKKNTEGKSYTIITGVAGYLYIRFSQYGRRKLPRKLKKILFLTKKLRQQHIPEYYGK